MMKKVTTIDFLKMKKNNEKISMLTSYDYGMAKAVDQAGIDGILIGDSMGMVIYGQNSTLQVTVDDIIRHTQAVVRAVKRAMVIADMPFMSFAIDEDAVRNAGRMIKEGGADAVKLEGGRERANCIKMMNECGIAVMGHIGLTPQYFHKFGGYKLQGKNSCAAERLIEDAIILEEAGVFSIVLEMVPWQVAQEISERINIPTIGIGAGKACDGQIFVAQDMFGFSNRQPYKFVKKYANIWDIMLKGTQDYIKDIKTTSFPAMNNSFSMDEDEFAMLKESLKNNPKINRHSRYNNIDSKDDKQSKIGRIYGN